MSTAYIGADASQYAQRLARYGHRDWIVWTGRCGRRHCDLVSRSSVKAALLAHGTQGDDMVLIRANTGCRTWLGWRQAITLWRNQPAQPQPAPGGEAQ
ncbi:hypothetical protein GO986_08910 [Deinococcus sp. HMF7620]|uniref:Uncharacterized protein n=1 Tax=Deinococcus arboris TaxID=2682977 RepID=A0A7C9M8F0_9DEIO|nr:hypothetical protein [Deinococcus arboris]MVN86883.1 hypothetical protein [Deinococcus arboris]